MTELLAVIGVVVAVLMELLLEIVVGSGEVLPPFVAGGSLCGDVGCPSLESWSNEFVPWNTVRGRSDGMDPPGSDEAPPPSGIELLSDDDPCRFVFSVGLGRMGAC